MNDLGLTGIGPTSGFSRKSLATSTTRSWTRVTQGLRRILLQATSNTFSTEESLQRGQPDDSDGRSGSAETEPRRTVMASLEDRNGRANRKVG